MIALRELKLDSSTLKLSIIPLDHSKSKRNKASQQAVKEYRLSEMNAPVELPSDGDEDYDDTSDSNLNDSQKPIKMKKLRTVMMNIDTK